MPGSRRLSADRRAICCWFLAPLPRCASTAWSYRSQKVRSAARRSRTRSCPPSRPTHGGCTANRASPTARSDRRISDASGSICTTSAAAPPRRSVVCPPPSRGSRRSTCRRRSRRSRACREVSCSSADRPDPARPPRWRHWSTRSTCARLATSSPSRIRSSTSTRIAGRSWSRSRSASTRPTFRLLCAPLFARRPTSSSSGRCAIRRRCRLPWRPEKPVTSCSPVFIRAMWRRRWRGLRTRFRWNVRTRYGRSWRCRWLPC